MTWPYINSGVAEESGRVHTWTKDAEEMERWLYKSLQEALWLDKRKRNKWEQKD